MNAEGKMLGAIGVSGLAVSEDQAITEAMAQLDIAEVAMAR
jgi:uncharacterized protein GlcG (DUF336 family)